MAAEREEENDLGLDPLDEPTDFGQIRGHVEALIGGAMLSTLGCSPALRTRERTSNSLHSRQIARSAACP